MAHVFSASLAFRAEASQSYIRVYVACLCGWQPCVNMPQELLCKLPSICCLLYKCGSEAQGVVTVYQMPLGSKYSSFDNCPPFSPADPAEVARILGRGPGSLPRKCIGYQFFDLATNQ